MAVAGILPTIGCVYLWSLRERKQLRHSPLTRNLLRPPGHTLRIKMIDAVSELVISTMILMLLPLVQYAVYISQSYFAGLAETPSRLWANIILGTVVFAYFARRLSSHLTQMKYDALGLEGEMATGEELNQLMLDGCRVYHDIPFPYGNIDHVVVSPSGVFAVNAKVLGKPKDADNAEVVVDQQRGIIRFPDREYRIRTQQFETEAKWLEDHLSASTGLPVDVESILALPGWFIKERIGKGPVYVINPYRPHKFFVHKRQVLSPERIQQIAHQLEQLVRDIEPSFRKMLERWEEANR